MHFAFFLGSQFLRHTQSIFLHLNVIAIVIQDFIFIKLKAKISLAFDLTTVFSNLQLKLKSEKSQDLDHSCKTHIYPSK